MTCIIAYRVHRGPVEMVLDDHGENVQEFIDLDDAQAFVDGNRLFRTGQCLVQIIDLDEL